MRREPLRCRRLIRASCDRHRRYRWNRKAWTRTARVLVITIILLRHQGRPTGLRRQAQSQALVRSWTVHRLITRMPKVTSALVQAVGAPVGPRRRKKGQRTYRAISWGLARIWERWGCWIERLRLEKAPSRPPYFFCLIFYFLAFFGWGHDGRDRGHRRWSTLLIIPSWKNDWKASFSQAGVLTSILGRDILEALPRLFILYV